MSALDLSAVALVAALRHRITTSGGVRRICRCEKCEAITRTVALARAQIANPRRARKAPFRNSLPARVPP